MNLSDIEYESTQLPAVLTWSICVFLCSCSYDTFRNKASAVLYPLNGAHKLYKVSGVFCYQNDYFCV